MITYTYGHTIIEIHIAYEHIHMHIIEAHTSIHICTYIIQIHSYINIYMYTELMSDLAKFLHCISLSSAILLTVCVGWDVAMATRSYVSLPDWRGCKLTVAIL